MADRPELPNQLDVLTERAARHLTPDEARALREQITDLRADLERARDVAAERDTYRRAWHSAKARARKHHDRAERAEQQLAQHTALLTEYVRLADALHTPESRFAHDVLGANLTCAGCDLRDRARTALDDGQQPEMPSARLNRQQRSKLLDSIQQPGPAGKGDR